MGLFDFIKRRWGQDPEPVFPREALMPWVHRRSHLEILKSIQLQRGIAPINLTCTTSKALAFTLAAMSQDGPVPVKPAQLKAMGLSTAEALSLSLRNVAPLFTQVGVQGGLAIFETAQEYAGAGVLLANMLAKHLPLRGAPILMLPDARLLLVAGEDDEAALTEMANLGERVFGESTDFRSLRAVRSEGPLFADWLPPPEHPLHARFRALAARTRLTEAEACYGAFNFDEQPLLAHLCARPAEEGGALVAAVARGTSVLVPEVDRLVLLDTDDSPYPRVEVDFDTFRSLFAASLDEIGVDEHGPVALAALDPGVKAPPPMFWRVVSGTFPTRRMMSFLAEREAWDRAHPEAVDRAVDPPELLAAWDSGVPLFVDALEGGDVGLTSADRRTARIRRDAELNRRIDALPEEDQANLHGHLLMMDMLTAIKDRDEAAVETAEAGSFRVQDLRERAAAGRVPLWKPEPDAGPSAMYDPLRLYPMLRPPGFDQGHEANLRGQLAHLSRDGQPIKVVDHERIRIAYQQGIGIELGCDFGETIVPVNASLIPEEAHEALWNAARMNLRAASQASLTRVAPGVWEAPWRDGFTASRLLLPDLFLAPAIRGEPLLFAPSVDRVWLTGSEDPDGIAAVLEAATGYLQSGAATSPYAWRELLFGTPWVLRNGALSPWQVPEGHPHASRIAALDEEIDRRRRNATAHIEEFAQAARRPEPEADA